MSAPAADGGRPGRRRIFLALTLLMALGASFALLEAGAYVYLRMAHGYDGEHLMNYEFDPYKNIRPTPNYRDTRGIVHNAQGFRRSSDTPREKPADTMRVFLMGGSTAYGLGSLSPYGQEKYGVIPNEETIAYHLERALEGAIPGKRVEVVNAAVTSFYSHHHLIYLNQTVLKYDPDVVVFLDGYNDYYPFQPGYDQFTDYANQERAHTFLGEPSVFAWSYYTSWWLVRKSHFFHALGLALKRLPSLLPGGHDRVRLDVQSSLRNLRPNSEGNWVRMVERNGLILRHEGIGAIFALQPEIALERSKRLSPMEEQIYAEMETHWPENFIELKRLARPIVLDYLQRATGRVAARAVDLTDIYAGVDGDVYTDYCHLTSTGNRVLAETLAPTVIQELQARLARSRAAETGG